MYNSMLLSVKSKMVSEELERQRLEKERERTDFELKENQRLAQYLFNIAEKGNIFAKYHLVSVHSDLKVNIEALLKRDTCTHSAQIGKRQVSTSAPLAPYMQDGFEVREEICIQCGKTTKIQFLKPKQQKEVSK